MVSAAAGVSVAHADEDDDEDGGEGGGAGEGARSVFIRLPAPPLVPSSSGAAAAAGISSNDTVAAATAAARALLSACASDASLMLPDGRTLADALAFPVLLPSEVAGAGGRSPAAASSSAAANAAAAAPKVQLFIANAPQAWLLEEEGGPSALGSHFSRFGEVLRALAPRNAAGQPKGYCFVEFAVPSAAARAKASLDELEASMRPDGGEREARARQQSQQQGSGAGQQQQRWLPARLTHAEWSSPRTPSQLLSRVLYLQNLRPVFRDPAKLTATLGRRHGPLVEVHVPRNRQTGAAKNFAFVEFARSADADAALRAVTTATEAAAAEQSEQQKQRAGGGGAGAAPGERPPMAHPLAGSLVSFANPAKPQEGGGGGGGGSSGLGPSSSSSLGQPPHSQQRQQLQPGQHQQHQQQQPFQQQQQYQQHQPSFGRGRGRGGGGGDGMPQPFGGDGRGGRGGGGRGRAGGGNFGSPSYPAPLQSGMTMMMPPAAGLGGGGGGGPANSAAAAIAEAIRTLEAPTLTSSQSQTALSNPTTALSGGGPGQRHNGHPGDRDGNGDECDGLVPEGEDDPPLPQAKATHHSSNNINNSSGKGDYGGHGLAAGGGGAGASHPHPQSSETQLPLPLPVGGGPASQVPRQVATYPFTLLHLLTNKAVLILALILAPTLTLALHCLLFRTPMMRHRPSGGTPSPDPYPYLTLPQPLILAII